MAEAQKRTGKERTSLVIGIISIPVGIIGGLIVALGGFLRSDLGVMITLTIAVMIVPILAIIFGGLTWKNGRRFGLIAGISAFVFISVCAAIGYGNTLERTVAVQRTAQYISSTIDDSRAEIEGDYRSSFSGTSCSIRATIPEDTTTLANTFRAYDDASTRFDTESCGLRLQSGRNSVLNEAGKEYWQVYIDINSGDSNIAVDWDALASWIASNKGCSLNLRAEEYSYDGPTVHLSCDGEESQYAQRYSELPNDIQEQFTVNITMESLR